jgi:hypothetical protein
VTRHFDGPPELIDGVWRNLCVTCRRSWPCAGWHDEQVAHHLHCATTKREDRHYPLPVPID